jgi:hypothetical protein
MCRHRNRALRQRQLLNPRRHHRRRRRRASSSETPIFFDARVVTRQDEGWEDMLERILLRWTSVVVEERRNRSRRGATIIEAVATTFLSVLAMYRPILFPFSVRIFFFL